MMKKIYLLLIVFYNVSFGITPEVLVNGSLGTEAVEVVGDNAFINFDKGDVVQVFNISDNITKSLIHTELVSSMAATNNYFFSMRSDTLKKFEANTGTLLESISLDSLYGDSNYELYHHDENDIIITNSNTIRIVDPITYSVIKSDSFHHLFLPSEADRNTFYNGKEIIHINSSLDFEHYDLEIDNRTHFFVFFKNCFIYSQVINNKFHVYSYNFDTKVTKELEFSSLAAMLVLNDKVALLKGRSVVFVNSELDILKTIVVNNDFAYSSVKKFDDNNLILVNRLTNSAYKLNINTGLAENFTEPISFINDFSVSNDEKYLFLWFTDFDGKDKYRVYDYQTMFILSEDYFDIIFYTGIYFVENVGFIFQKNENELYSIDPEKILKKKLFLKNDNGIDIFKVIKDEILISKDNKLSIYNLNSKNLIDTIVIEKNITEIFSNSKYYILGSKEEDVNKYYLNTIDKFSSEVKTIGTKSTLNWDDGRGPINLVTEKYLYSLKQYFDGESLLFIYPLDDIYSSYKRFEFEDFRAIIALDETTLICSKREPFRLEKYVFDENHNFSYKIEETTLIEPIYEGVYTRSKPDMGTLIKMNLVGDKLVYTSGVLSSLRRIDINKLKSEVKIENELSMSELKEIIDRGLEIKIYDYIGNSIQIDSSLGFDSFYSQLSENKLYIVNIVQNGEVKFFKFFK